MAPLAEEQEDELSEAHVVLLLRWLQEGRLLPDELPAGRRRVTAHCLADLEIISAAVQRICPATVATHAQAGTVSCPSDIVSSCLRDVLQEVYGQEVNAESVLQQALQAGERGMEPLNDIVTLWRYVLAFAVCCESKQVHVDGILRMPSDLQSGLMELIERTERELSSPDSTRGLPERKARVSLSGLQGRVSLSGQRTPRASVASSLHTGAEAAGDGNEGLLQENRQLRERARTLEEQLEKGWQLRQRTTAVLDGEFETFERSWQLEKLLGEREQRVRELELELGAARAMVEENTRLTDQLQLAQAREAEHAAVKVRLERCMQRLEEAGDLRHELQLQAERHAAAVQEREALSQEIAQLRGAGQQLEAWKLRVRDLELRQREAEAEARAEKGRREEVDLELKRVEAERHIVEERLQDCQVELAALRERGPSAPEGGEVVEPFTPELRERMAALESRNALLEEQLTAEGSQRVAQLIVEGESLRDLKEHWEGLAEEEGAKRAGLEGELQAARARLLVLEEECSRLEETERALEEECSYRQELEESFRSSTEGGAMLTEELRQRLCAMHFLCEELSQANERLSELQEELEQEHSAAEARAALLSEFKDQLDDVRSAAGTLQQEHDDLEEALQEARESGSSWHRQLLASSQQASQLEQRCMQLQEARTEALQLQREQQLLLDGERHLRVAAESQLGTVASEKAELQRQLQHLRCEQRLQETGRNELAAREEVSLQRQSDLLVRIDDLRKGLAQEAVHSRCLREQLEASEAFVQQLKAAVRRFSLEELRRVEEEQEQAAAMEDDSLPLAAPESELAQARAENRLLQAELTEQRLRGADEAKRSAQACAKLRHMERCCAEQAQARSEGSPTLCPLQHCDSSAGCGSPSIQEPQIKEATQKVNSSPQVFGTVTPGTTPRTASAPRCSILKKPKQAEVSMTEFNNKENCLVDVSGKATEVSKRRNTILRSRRPGLIGSG